MGFKIKIAVVLVCIVLLYVFLKPIEQEPVGAIKPINPTEFSSTGDEDGPPKKSILTRKDTPIPTAKAVPSNCTMDDDNQLLSFHGRADSSKLAAAEKKLSSLVFEVVNLRGEDISIAAGSMTYREKLREILPENGLRYRSKDGKIECGNVSCALSHNLPATPNCLHYDGDYHIWGPSPPRGFLKPANAFPDIPTWLRYMLSELKIDLQVTDNPSPGETDDDKAGKTFQFELETSSGVLKRYRMVEKKSDTANFNAVWISDEKDKEWKRMQSVLQLANDLKKQCVSK